MRLDRGFAPMISGRQIQITPMIAKLSNVVESKEKTSDLVSPNWSDVNSGIEATGCILLVRVSKEI